MAETEQHPALNLALIGYGKTGKAVAQLAPTRGFEVRLILTAESNRGGAGINKDHFRGVDIAVDFTAPEAVVENVRLVAGLGCNMVVGTSGWNARLEEVRSIVERAGTGLLYASNFSIGAQLFFRAAEAAARVFAKFPMFEPYITETHHHFKKDAPSGTAVELKRRIQPSFEEREVPVASIRAGFFPGTHELGFDSEADTVILRHTSRGRQGFAEGALYAARWLVGKKGIFAFSDLFTGVGEEQRS